MNKKPRKFASGATQEYHGYRDANGITPSQKLAMIKSQLVMLDVQERRGALVKREDVERRDAEQNEIILSDMMAFPDKLCFALAGKVFTVDQVRSAVGKVVHEVLTQWKNSGIGKLPENEPKQNNADRV